MNGTTVRRARESQALSQAALAKRLGVSQAYLSLLESNERPLTARLQKNLASVLSLGPTALPLPDHVAPPSGDRLAALVGALGYPGFAHLGQAPAANPAETVLAALLSPDLDARLSEALPWVLVRYFDLDWDWLVTRAKLHDLQNRLGFLVDVARDVATSQNATNAADVLDRWWHVLERSRLDKDEPLSATGVTTAERRWFLKHRSAGAGRWRVLSTLSPDTLPYAVH
jgi:transcriptional regulator with XRE-family HTH domain